MEVSRADELLGPCRSGISDQEIFIMIDLTPIDLIERSLKLDFCHDWDCRWRAAGYFASYQIGQVEEVISFAPHEVADSIEAASVVAFPLAMQHLMPEDGPVHLPQIVDVMWRSSMGLVEYFVRRKHGLPMKAPLKQCRRIIERLIKRDPSSRTEDEKRMWSLMLFGLVVPFTSMPADHNWLQITDIAPTDTLRPADWNPAHSEELIMQKEAQYRELGARSFRSARVTIS